MSKLTPELTAEPTLPAPNPEPDGTPSPALTDDEAAQAIARALADPQRWRIVRALACGAAGQTPCASLRDVVDVAPPTLSHHMRELRDAGLVEEQRVGRTVQYRLRREVMKAFLGVLERELLGTP